MRLVDKEPKNESFTTWLWIVAIALTLTLFVSAAMAAEFTVRYVEPTDPDVAVCQFEVRRVPASGPFEVIVLSQEFVARRNQDPIDVTFSGALVASVGDRLDMIGTCKDEAGSRSVESNAITITVPAPPPTPPGPPRIQACEFNVTYSDGATQTIPCVIGQ